MEKVECSYILKYPIFLTRNTQSLVGFSCSQVFFTQTLRQLKHLILCRMLAVYSMGSRKEGTEWITKQGMTFSFQLWSLCSRTVTKNLSTWVGFLLKGYVLGRLLMQPMWGDAACKRRARASATKQGPSTSLGIPTCPLLSYLELGKVGIRETFLILPLTVPLLPNPQRWMTVGQ